MRKERGREAGREIRDIKGRESLAFVCLAKSGGSNEEEEYRPEASGSHGLALFFRTVTTRLQVRLRSDEAGMPYSNLERLSGHFTDRVAVVDWRACRTYL